MAKNVTVRLQTVILTKAGFMADAHARRYADVVNDGRINFDKWLEFFSHPLRQLRMLDAERHHDRPALGGVVRELESHADFSLLPQQSRDKTRRHRQAIGVIVKLVMVGHGWRTTGSKGFLGGGRSGGLSQVFGKAERYVM